MSEALRPTLEEIELAKRLQAEHLGRQPGSAAEARKVISQIYADWHARKGLEESTPNPGSLLEYVEAVAKDAGVTNEDRGDVRALWSWRSQPEGADREIPHRYLAQACGRTRGYQVLEDSPAGQQLDGYWLGDDQVRNTLVRSYGMKLDDVKASADKAWDGVSARYIGEARGTVAVFAAEIGEKSILGGTELPVVMDNELVGKDGLQFPIEFPHPSHLPADMRDLLADPAVRAVLRREHYDPEHTTPQQFAAKLAAFDLPEHLRPARTAAVAQLNTAPDYAGLTGPAAEAAGPELTEPETLQPGSHPRFQDPELAEPASDQPASVPATPAQPEPRVPVHGASFLPGSTVPRTLTVPPRPAPAVASTHGVMNPAVEAAPKAPEIDQ
ncbi:hypothetical protein GCM10010302_73400 [Streptomyces polychromogenes]|uniref:Uncharacterized protein n=1 Tax=Streptomyces polychromogenes TaxID=67342 RepID=A0ABP3FQL2_9ACTN